MIVTLSFGEAFCREFVEHGITEKCGPSILASFPQCGTHALPDFVVEQALVWVMKILHVKSPAGYPREICIEVRVIMQYT
jgi:hypothetical protein